MNTSPDKHLTPFERTDRAALTLPRGVEVTDASILGNLLIGHATDHHAATGCTVLVCPQGAVGGVDVRGGAPATRETDLLSPENTVDVVHAVVLSGGSAFGLAAGAGVCDELEARGIGFDVGVTHVPIVVQACLFDLAVGDSLIRPTAEFGLHAVRDSFARKFLPVTTGNVGAGTGACVGKICGIERAMKAGLGICTLKAGELVCGALVALNALGDIRNPQTGEPLVGLRSTESAGWFYRHDGEHECASAMRTIHLASTSDVLLSKAASDVMPLTRTNTTIACVFTNAQLTKAQATKVSQMAHDAYAHCITPTHTTNDGDTIFTLSCGTTTASVDAVGELAIKALEAAIIDAVVSSQSACGLPGYDATSDDSHL